MYKSYREMNRLQSFEDRFEYLRLVGDIGESTFGFDRWMNQQFYQSREWKQVREYAIVRDNGCDLGVLGYDIHTELLVHHINPLKPDSIIHFDESLLDPDNLITTTHRTHNAIHYGTDTTLLPETVPERQPNDTKLW